MIKFFGEIEVNTEFTYILWQLGKTVMKKTDNNHAIILHAKAFNEKFNHPYEFHYNDLVQLADTIDKM
jgi:hypothetical protein